jgi:hypothetical protein
MMKTLLLGCCLLLSVGAMAQREKTEAYVRQYKELAMREMQRSGVPAAITLAQGILESQSGESDLAKASNNHFGIKCKTEWTGARTYHDDDERGECFRVYPTVDESYRDHSDFLRTRPHYAFLFKLDPTDYEGWATGLKKAGYATSPTYPQKLIKVIHDYNLQEYTLLALSQPTTPSPEKTSTTSVKTEAANNQTIAAELPVQTSVPAITMPAEKTPAPQPVQEGNTAATVAETGATTVSTPVKNYPAGVFTINHSKVIYANAGTSLLALAMQYDVALARLIEFNDLAEMEVLDTDRLIFLEKKMKKGVSDFHVVQSGETLHDICQLEGIRLDSLLEYNRLEKKSVLTPGDKLWLKPMTVVPAPKK